MQSCLPSTLSFSDSSGIILANEIPANDQNIKDGSSVGDETTNSSNSNRKEGTVLFYIFLGPQLYDI